ncbi:hypothetical protein Pmani_003840 [Petrolisthes manimaculis]|uniref:Uncharacterized protein n=1 Tax=Petrolisthes manimaculis TaxID=1843537 RepID=A0AAE1QFT5_9EUCA|nr:hypothetical protein Pmani_003840 [Petrolisthes manimaculis]
MDQLFLSEDEKLTYDRRQTPFYTTGTPTRVHIEMYIRSFGSVNPIQMDYSVDLYLRQRWVELRFLNNSLTRAVDLNDPLLVKVLWKPEVYFPNAKESDFQYVTVPNVMLRIHPDGTILYILRLKLTFSCMMDLSSYPLDHQTCYIQIASFVKTTRELELEWYADSPIKMYRRFKLPQFEMKEIKPETCDQSFHIGNYSCLQAAFELRRNIGYHLVQSYLPTSLIVVVSWVSFWLDVDAIPSRVTLGVTTLLTVCSESTSFRDKMPTVSYVKALDIWMGSCTAFVFLALVEFTVVSHIARHHRRYLFWGSVYYRAHFSPAHTHASSTTHPSTIHPISSTKVSTHMSSTTHVSTPQTSFTKTCTHTSSSTPHTSAAHASSSVHTHKGSSDPLPHSSSACSPSYCPVREMSQDTLHSSSPSPRHHHSPHSSPSPPDRAPHPTSPSSSTTTQIPPHSTTIPSHLSSSTYNTAHYPRPRLRPSSLPRPRDTLQDSVKQMRRKSAAVHTDFVEVEEKGSLSEAEGRDKGGGGKEDEDSELPYPPTDEEEEMVDEDLVRTWREEAVLAKRIDKTCRALFPFLFIIFNLIYWIHYQVIT